MRIERVTCKSTMMARFAFRQGADGPNPASHPIGAGACSLSISAAHKATPDGETDYLLSGHRAGLLRTAREVCLPGMRRFNRRRISISAYRSLNNIRQQNSQGGDAQIGAPASTPALPACAGLPNSIWTIADCAIRTARRTSRRERLRLAATSDSIDERRNRQPPGRQPVRRSKPILPRLPAGHPR